VNGDVDAAFRDTLRKLEDAGATIVEVDLGEDFMALAARSTWPIFFHETMPALQAFLAANDVPASFEQIYEGLGPQIREAWSRAVVPSAPGHVSVEKYRAALRGRAELRRRLASSAFARADAMLFPTTPCAAPRIDSQWQFEVGGMTVTDLFLSRHTHPSSCAGGPGVSLPMALNAHGLPLGLELDAAPGRDRKLLALARRVERLLGRLPAPAAL
jgi:indoleacetamide hydrolase